MGGDLERMVGIWMVEQTFLDYCPVSSDEDARRGALQIEATWCGAEANSPLEPGGSESVENCDKRCL